MIRYLIPFRLTMTCLLLLACIGGFSQTEPWIRFTDTIAELSGYKDTKGNIKIPPRFGALTSADTFHHIIAVQEGAAPSKSYYLLKNGKKVGMDSVYAFDFLFDCEAEGYILFRDYKKDQVGFLDSNGVVAIPAQYSEADPFVNGVAVALRGARKTRRDTTDEHPIWEGGEWLLIDKSNQVLAKLEGHLSNINWYSFRRDNKGLDTSIYKKINGLNGSSYYVMDYQLEFEQWFHRHFLPATARGDRAGLRKQHLLDTIVYWREAEGWQSIDTHGYLSRFGEQLKQERFTEAAGKEVWISGGDVNPFIFTGPLYRLYYGACGEHNRNKYPVFNVIVTYKGAKKSRTPDHQDQYSFIRTAGGYKLFSVSAK